ncbi:MAG: septal ring lytic transglycosylase RlpA family protein [Hyphomicrobium sp.]|nr:septal ring lytic transglycosylase RlpA family protein [Hyphomicrobium sp.]
MNRPAPIILATCLALAACSSGSGVQSEKRLGVPSSERVHAHAGPMPKGGGVYKLGKPYLVAGRWYYPREQPGYDQVGVASWYGRDFHGRKTANGEIYDMNRLSAAHPTLPLPSYVYVTNLDNNRTVLLRVNDRGPYVGNRIIDLSGAAARALGTSSAGLGKVRVRYAGHAPLSGDDSRERRFLAGQPWSSNRYAAERSPEPAPFSARPRDERLARYDSLGAAPEPVTVYERRASPAAAPSGWSPLAYRATRGK